MSEDEERARRRRTIAGGLFVVALLGLSIWVAQAMSERQALERCLASGRRDCANISIPSDRSYVPAR